MPPSQNKADSRSRLVCVCVFVCVWIHFCRCVCVFEGREEGAILNFVLAIFTRVWAGRAHAQQRASAHKKKLLSVDNFIWLVRGSGARVAAHAHAYAAFRLTRVVIRVSAPNTNWERRRLRERFFLFVRLVWRIFLVVCVCEFVSVLSPGGTGG